MIGSSVTQAKKAARKVLPKSVYDVLRFATNRRDLAAIVAFLRDDRIGLPVAERAKLLAKFYEVSFKVDCPHYQHQMIDIASAILRTPTSVRGCILEAGCFKGGSTAKLSLLAELCDRELLVYDSFEGIPDNDEAHRKDIFGNNVAFPKGSYCGRLESVKDVVTRFGRVERCRFVKGWFDDTLPGLREDVVVAFVDVDLVSSTKTCLTHIFPRVVPGGTIFSHDGHLPLVIELLDDRDFWAHQLAVSQPKMKGLGKDILVEITKAEAS